MEYRVLEAKKPDSKGYWAGKKTFVQEDPRRSFRQYFFPNEGLPNDEETVVQSNGLKTFGGKEKTNNYRPAKTLAAMTFGSSYVRRQDFCWMVSGAYISHNVYLREENYKKVLMGAGLFWSIKHTWLNHEQCLHAPSRPLSPQEETDAILYAIMSPRNRTTTARMEEMIITTKKGRTINGGIIVENKLNPFDKKLFDWSECSSAGQEVLRLYKHYLDKIVNWKEQETVLGKGAWLGMYQYHRIKPIPKELVNAIETLRQSVEQTALEVCF